MLSIKVIDECLYQDIMNMLEEGNNVLKLCSLSSRELQSGSGAKGKLDVCTAMKHNMVVRYY